MSTNAIIVIPARLESTRLNRKLLLDETGKPLIVHTLNQARQSRLAEKIVVITDSEEIAAAVDDAGGMSIFDENEFRNGTERVLHACGLLGEEFDVVVNLQAEYAEIDPTQIDAAIRESDDNGWDVVTLATPITTAAELTCTSTVKVAMRKDVGEDFDDLHGEACGQAMYFSRAVIPHGKHWNRDWLYANPPVFWRHVGLYAFAGHVLGNLNALEPCDLETVEDLEQLRWLHAGHVVKVLKVPTAAHGIDTLGDYESFVRRRMRSNEL